VSYDSSDGREKYDCSFLVFKTKGKMYIGEFSGVRLFEDLRVSLAATCPNASPGWSFPLANHA